MQDKLKSTSSKSAEVKMNICAQLQRFSFSLSSKIIPFLDQVINAINCNSKSTSVPPVFQSQQSQPGNGLKHSPTVQQGSALFTQLGPSSAATTTASSAYKVSYMFVFFNSENLLGTAGSTTHPTAPSCCSQSANCNSHSHHSIDTFILSPFFRWVSLCLPFLHPPVKSISWMSLRNHPF